VKDLDLGELFTTAVAVGFGYLLGNDKAPKKVGSAFEQFLDSGNQGQLEKAGQNGGQMVEISRDQLVQLLNKIDSIEKRMQQKQD